MKMRYYDPKTGRFLQPDPIGYIDGLNIYSFAQNDPNDLSDQLGLASATLITAAATIAVIAGIIIAYNLYQSSLVKGATGHGQPIDLRFNENASQWEMQNANGDWVIYDRAIKKTPVGEETPVIFFDGWGNPFYFIDSQQRQYIKNGDVLYMKPGQSGAWTGDSSVPVAYYNSYTQAFLNIAWGTNTDPITTYYNQWTGSYQNAGWGNNGGSPSIYFNKNAGLYMNASWGNNTDSPTTYINKWTGEENDTGWGNNGWGKNGAFGSKRI